MTKVRLKWLGSGADTPEMETGDSDGDTMALRESLSQLSNASSPAESVVSTSSNPGTRGHSSSGRHRDKKRGKKVRMMMMIIMMMIIMVKGRPGSKNGSSRGSTPPMEH